nr:unnamed protein product [Spirometra erinaceieuropaei]
MGGARRRVLPSREVEKDSPSKALSRRHSITSPISKRLRSRTGNLKSHTTQPIAQLLLLEEEEGEEEEEEGVTRRIGD